MSPMSTTLIDGELVMDVDPQTKVETMRFLAFDCLISNDEYVMDRTLDKRYGVRPLGFKFVLISREC